MAENARITPTVVSLTLSQEEIINTMIVRSLKPGGSVMAQVYGDGMRVAVLTPDQTIAVAKALGLAEIGLPYHNSAYDAHAAAEERQQSKS